MSHISRRGFLAASVPVFAGCTGGSTQSQQVDTTDTPTRTKTSREDLGTTTTAPPPSEFARQRVRRLVVQALTKQREQYGFSALERNDQLRRLAQKRAKTVISGTEVESADVRLERIGCANGGEIVADVPIESPVQKPGDESGTTVIETAPELATYLGNYWIQPSEERQTILEGVFSRVGVGVYLGDQKRIAVAVAFCE